MEVVMSFGDALNALKEGKKVQRSGWNGKGMYLYLANQKLKFPPLDENHKWMEDAFPESEFIVMKTADGKLIPWLASQTDVLADDWGII
jgi:hypothetical protein